ncbi:MAG: hypothetical protein U9Q15_04555, partial [Patescibacteria group bacterium]|nr:hypothetical protein [Patescibacteria group bacterium]
KTTLCLSNNSNSFDSSFNYDGFSYNYSIDNSTTDYNGNILFSLDDIVSSHDPICTSELGPYPEYCFVPGLESSIKHYNIYSSA